MNFNDGIKRKCCEKNKVYSTFTDTVFGSVDG